VAHLQNHTINAKAKFCKRATKPKHQDRHEITMNKNDRIEGRSANMNCVNYQIKIGNFLWFNGAIIRLI
jgi:hypothetical protein